MFTPRPSAPSTSIRRTRPSLTAALFSLVISAPAALQAQTSIVHTRALTAIGQNSATDSGLLPVSQTLSLTLRLAPSAAQTAALDQLLAAQTDGTSPSYHRWLTPAQYAQQFGASDAQLASLTAWLESNSLTVSSVSAAHTRVEIQGTTDAVQRAFNVSLHRFTTAGQTYFANATEPSIPPALSGLIAGISGLDNLPSPAAARISASSGVPTPAVSARAVTALAPADTDRTISSTGNEAATADSLAAAAAIVDANSSPILTLASSACSASFSQSEIDGWRALLRQADAQGITVLATSSCATSGVTSFPAALGEATALTLSPSALTSTGAGVEDRPSWQAAPGLPADGSRAEPDFTAGSVAAVAQTVHTLIQQTGNRVGNLNSTLYSLAATPGLFSQPESSAASPGTWQPSTGLGTIDLNTLVKVYPRGSIPTLIDFQATTYAINYGSPVSLRAVINSSGFGPSGPTGTVTFSAASQGVLGSAPVSAGVATLDPGVLPVGSYAITATYSGDTYYAASSKGAVTVTVSLVTATLAAALSPSTPVPYGGTATVTATVTLPAASAAPSGDVKAQVIGLTGALYGATLSPNPGGNSGTGNIVVSIPPPGTYTVQVSCQDNPNFQCQTPVNLPIKSIKGYTGTKVTVNPAAPQAGQPIYVTASVANSGNGSGNYTHSGTIDFFDSGKLIATVPVGTNQATTALPLSAARTHTLTAVYSGDINWNGSTSPAVAVSPTISSATLTLTTNTNGLSSLAGVNIVLTGTVSTNSAYISGPTGWVTYFDTFNGAVIQLGSPAALVANGRNAAISTLTTTGLLPGVHRISAQYSGDDNYSPSTGSTIALQISDFSLSMTPNNLTVSQGKSAQVSALVSISGGFTGTVALGCVPPSGTESTCNFSPASLSGSGITTMTIVTTASRTPSSTQQARLRTRWSAVTGVTLSTLFLLFVPGRRRSMPTLLLVLLSVSLASNLGCGAGLTASSTQTTSSTGTNPSDPGTPLGTQNYTVTAAGSDGINTVRHTYQYQVTVQ